MVIGCDPNKFACGLVGYSTRCGPGTTGIISQQLNDVGLDTAAKVPSAGQCSVDGCDGSCGSLGRCLVRMRR